MRKRLIASYLLLMCLVLLALEIPLGAALVSRDTEQVAADRLADAAYFASRASPALRDESLLDTVAAELTRYHEVYGIRAAVLDRENALKAASGEPRLDGAARAAVHEALNGRPVSTHGVVLPWRDTPLVTAAPITNGGEVLGAVVTISPTDKLRGRVGANWMELGGAGLLAVLACAATAFGLARWVLRPVTELAATAGQITAGQHAARVPEDTGPPELRRLAASFNEMADTVTEALDRQRSFVAHASHQLRNPLTALRLRVEELGLELTDPAARTEQQLALAETDRLGHVLDGLLALARAERSRHALITVDAVAVARGRMAAWQPLAARRGVDFTLVAPEGRLLVRAVHTALDQALDALIDNALKFAAGRPGPRVTVSVTGTDGGVAVHVTDNGPGLAADQRRRAAEPFWRAPDAQNIQGAGLGLAIARVFIDASGGRLDLLPAAGHGLDARVWLRYDRAGSP